MRDHPEEAVAISGAVGPMPLEDVLFYAQKAGRIAPLQCVRADRVVGEHHVRSAALHAARAFEEGRNQADRIEVEFLRYLAGERQIRRALEKMGLPDPAPNAIVCALGPKRLDALQYFLHALGLDEDDSLLEPSEEKLEAFGIQPAQVEATTPARRLDLVLEAVASVDLHHA